MRRQLIVIGLFLPLLMALLLILYLFRTEKFDNPERGIMTFHYRWGRPVIVTADTNRDGRVDFRSVGDPPFGPASSHALFISEYWEDADFDGIFDRHVILKAGVISTIELDLNADGHYEKILTGEEAKNFYKDELGRPEKIKEENGDKK